MKASELAGDSLDMWAQAAQRGEAPLVTVATWAAENDYGWRPSEDWSQGGPIIQRWKIAVVPVGRLQPLWFAEIGGVALDSGVEVGYGKHQAEGETALIAAMRVFVMAKFGDELPE